MIIESSKPLGLVGKKHPALSTRAVECTPSKEVSLLASRLLSTCRKHHGLAIAACQVGEPINLVVTVSGHAYLNVEVAAFGNEEDGIEGCLSLPGRNYLVPRLTDVVVTALDTSGESILLNESSLMARCWQHEYDHLQGKLISTWPER